MLTWVSKGLDTLDSENYVPIIVVTEQAHEGRTIFVCTKCGLGYDDILVAFACEEYFREYGESCTDIVKKAVYNPKTSYPHKRNLVPPSSG